MCGSSVCAWRQHRSGSSSALCCFWLVKSSITSNPVQIHCSGKTYGNGIRKKEKKKSYLLTQILKSWEVWRLLSSKLGSSEGAAGDPGRNGFFFLIFYSTIQMPQSNNEIGGESNGGVTVTFRQPLLPPPLPPPPLTQPSSQDLTVSFQLSPSMPDCPRRPPATVLMTQVRVLSAQSCWSHLRFLLVWWGEAHPSIHHSPFCHPAFLLPLLSFPFSWPLRLWALHPQFAFLNYIHTTTIFFPWDPPVAEVSEETGSSN